MRVWMFYIKFQTQWTGSVVLGAVPLWLVLLEYLGDRCMYWPGCYGWASDLVEWTHTRKDRYPQYELEIGRVAADRISRVLRDEQENTP